MRPVGTTSTWRHRLKAFCTCAASSRRKHNVSQQHGESRECPEFLRHPLTTQGVCLIQKHASCCRRATATGVCVAAFSRRRAAGSPNTDRPSAVRSSSPACAETWAHWSLHTTAAPVGAMHWPHSLPGGFTNSQHYENTPLSHYMKHNKNTPVWA